MSLEGEGHPQVCALPGCDELIVQPPGGPPRRYCCRQHRVAARKQRYETRMAAGGEQRPTAGAGERTRATRRPTRDNAAVRPGNAALAEQWRAAWVRARSAVLRARGAAARRTPASAGAAPRLHLGGRVRKAVRRIGPRLPSLPPRGAWVSIGLAALVAVMISGDAGPRLSAGRALAPGPSAAPDGSLSAREWRAGAQRALEAMDRHLGQIRRAERAVAAVPSDRRNEEIRKLNRRLADSKAELRRQRASLRTALAATRMSRKTAGDLESVREQRDAVDRALESLRELPGDARDEVSQELDGLRDRVETLNRQEKVLSAANENWREAAEQARTKPVPSPPADTPGLVEQVLEAANPLKQPESPKPEPEPDEPKPQKPQKPAEQKPEPAEPEQSAPAHPKEPAKPEPKPEPEAPKPEPKPGRPKEMPEAPERRKDKPEKHPEKHKDAEHPRCPPSLRDLFHEWKKAKLHGVHHKGEDRPICLHIFREDQHRPKTPGDGKETPPPRDHHDDHKARPKPPQQEHWRDAWRNQCECFKQKTRPCTLIKFPEPCPDDGMDPPPNHDDTPCGDRPCKHADQAKDQVEPAKQDREQQPEEQPPPNRGSESHPHEKPEQSASGWPETTVSTGQDTPHDADQPDAGEEGYWSTS